jgi:hypothetical protein
MTEITEVTEKALSRGTEQRRKRERDARGRRGDMRSIMPRTRKPQPTDVPETVLDQFAGPARPMSQVELDAITTRFKKALVERMLGGELTHHLGYLLAGRSCPSPPISATARAARRCSPIMVR